VAHYPPCYESMRDTNENPIGAYKYQT